jgi:signal transduction histidine kinase
MALLLIIVYKNNNRRKQDLHKMAELHKNLKESSQELSDLNRNKDRILSIISHDLRSPFSQLITFLAFAEDGDLTEEEMQQVNREMLINAKNGLHMLDNLLYWASTQRSEVRLHNTTFLVAEVLNEIKEQMSYLAQGKDVKIQLSCPLNLSAYGDRILFEIIARNLLSNALKFSNSGFTVEITAQEKGKEVQVCVRDYGSGIPDKVLTSLKNHSFDYDSSAGTKGEKGAGMGLYLSMEFAKQNNGSLSFIREKDGTRACINLSKA